MKDLMKLLASKKDSKMDPTYKGAKMGVLKEIHKMASDDLGEEVKGLKKVTVAAPDKESLEEGLKKAQEIVHSKGDEDGEEAEGAEDCEDCGKDPCECEGLTPEEEKVLAKLLAKKSKQSDEE